MDQTTSDQIESHIRSTRQDLLCNLEELERRVKSVVDWREQFRRNPALGAALAFGVGFLLASMTTRPRQRVTGNRLAPPVYREPRARLRPVWENMQSTLIDIAAARAMDLLRAFLLGHGEAQPHRAARGAADNQRGYRTGPGSHSAEACARGADRSRAARHSAPRQA